MPDDSRFSTMDRQTLDLLVCPATKSALTYLEARNELVSKAAGFAYPIRDGVPVMLADQARRLSVDELAALDSAPPRQ